MKEKKETTKLGQGNRIPASRPTLEQLEQEWERLTFTNDYIFSRVMHDEDICRQVVELILKIKVGKIQYFSTQSEQRPDHGSMKVTLDVHLKDEQRIITVEMQTKNTKELPQRSRYYHSASDIVNTSSGSKYKNLPDNIVIFICTFDTFQWNLPMYTFYYTCEETSHQLKLGDGSLRIFLNTSCQDLSPLDQNLQGFYHYIKGMVAETKLTQTIAEKITTLKKDSIERRYYMTWAMKIADERDEAYAIGREAGLEQGREEGISVGLEQGTYQKALETAQKFLSMGLSLEQVAEGTNLPLETIQELRAGIDK